MAESTPIAAEVLQYSETAVGELLVRYSHLQSASYQVYDDSHVEYLNEYLRALHAQTIIVEEHYTDRDYLEDYAAYYVRCHEPYKRTCTRLHFFSEAFDQGFFDKALSGDDVIVETLKASYLGFVVVKPLPLHVIGRTCLKPYPNDANHKRFFVTHTYAAHLFGIKLSISSIPFQEQDRDVAACATSALWSALNGTGRTFHHKIPTPAEITVAATEMRGLGDRALPALNGLTVEQIAYAVSVIGLEALTIDIEDQVSLKLASAAYLRAGIPSVLIGSLAKQSTPTEILDWHAMTVVGYRQPKPLEPQDTAVHTIYTASGIERLYVHDDGVGPFARLRFEKPGPLLTSWKEQDKDGNPDVVIFQPAYLVVPLYHKIRVPLRHIELCILELQLLIEIARFQASVSIVSAISWDVWLQDCQSFKEEIFHRSDLNPERRTALLRQRLPRFIWRVAAYSDKLSLFELVFDATDLVDGPLLVSAIDVHRTHCEEIGIFFSDSAVLEMLQRPKKLSVIKVMKWFAELVPAD